MDLTKKLVID